MLLHTRSSTSNLKCFFAVLWIKSSCNDIFRTFLRRDVKEQEAATISAPSKLYILLTYSLVKDETDTWLVQQDVKCVCQSLKSTHHLLFKPFFNALLQESIEGLFLCVLKHVCCLNNQWFLKSRADILRAVTSSLCFCT